MAGMKISVGPRYQKTGSPSQKKDRKIAEIMTLAIDEALRANRKKPHHEVKIALLSEEMLWETNQIKE